MHERLIRNHGVSTRIGRLRSRSATNHDGFKQLMNGTRCQLAIFRSGKNLAITYTRNDKIVWEKSL